MKNFNRHRGEGFSFIEVIASLMMMGVLLSALLTMEGSVLDRFRRSAQREDHIYLLKNYLFSLTQSGADTAKKQETLVDGATLLLVYEPISQKSALSRFQGLRQQKISVAWNDDTKQRTLDFIGYTFTPPEKKEEKK